MKEEKRNIVKELSLEFSIKILDFVGKNSNKKTALNPNQIVRSGTSIGAMIREAQEAESRKDFIHKLKIAFKEAEETEYWLILFASEYQSPEILDLKYRLVEIKKLLSKIISSSIRNEKK